MIAVEPVTFGSPLNTSQLHDFYYNKAFVENATVIEEAAFFVSFKAASDGDLGEESIQVPVELDGAVFRGDVVVDGLNRGMVQWGIQGDLDILSAFAAAKFPTLLGDTFIQGKTVFVDRSRKRVGFARNNAEICGTTATPADIDYLGANSVATPGVGCRRGTGSGGGCT